MGVRAMWAERGWQKTSVACTDRILSRAGVRARRERLVQQRQARLRAGRAAPRGEEGAHEMGLFIL